MPTAVYNVKRFFVYTNDVPAYRDICSMNLMQWKVDRWRRQRKKDSWPFPSPCGTGVFPAWIYRPTVCMATLDTTSTVYCNFAHGRLLFPAGIFAAHRHHRHHRCTQARYVSVSPSIHFSVTYLWTGLHEMAEYIVRLFSSTGDAIR